MTPPVPTTPDRKAMPSRRRLLSSPAVVLVSGLLFFLCGQLALSLAIEYWRPDLRDLEYGAKRVRLLAKLKEQPERPLLLVIGSSRCNLGIRPDALPPLPAVCSPHHPEWSPQPPVVFNHSIMGSGPVQELLWLNRLRSEGIRPDWVLLECWPPYLFQEGERSEYHRIQAARLGWRDVRVLRHYHPEPGRLVQDWCLARLTPWWSSRFAIMTQFARDWLPCETRRDDLWKKIDASGWLPFHGLHNPEATRIRAERTKELFVPVLRDYRLSPHADRALREALTLCQREHIGVALLFMPETKEFQSWYSPAVRQEINEYLQRLAADYALPLIDARDWVPDEEFGDGYHLLPEGARVFTERLGREALPALLQSHTGRNYTARVPPSHTSAAGSD